MDARALIVKADAIARERNFNQAKWSAAAGYAENGQTVSRIMAKGDCRISTFIALLNVIGCKLEITEDGNERNEG